MPSDSSTQGEPFQTSTTMDSGNSSNNASSSRDGNQRAPSLPSADISAGGSDFSNSVPVVTKETKKEYLGPWVRLFIQKLCILSLLQMSLLVSLCASVVYAL